MRRREFLTQTLPALAVTPLLPPAIKTGRVAAHSIQAALGQEWPGQSWLAEIEQTIAALGRLHTLIATGEAEAETFYDAEVSAQETMDALSLRLADSEFETFFAVLTGREQWLVYAEREIRVCTEPKELARWRLELACFPDGQERQRLLALVEEREIDSVLS